MNICDTFVILDDVDLQQGNKSSKTSRTNIRGINGEILLIVPVKKNTDGDRTIANTFLVDDARWKAKHLKSIYHSYLKCRYFEEFYPHVENLYTIESGNLSELNSSIIISLAKLLDIKCDVVFNSGMHIGRMEKDDRIIEVCKRLGAETYICGAGGKKYMVKEKYDAAGVNVEYTDFVHPHYRQNNFNDFIAGLSVMDVIFNCGLEKTKEYISKVSI